MSIIIMLGFELPEIFSENMIQKGCRLDVWVISNRDIMPVEKVAAGRKREGAARDAGKQEGAACTSMVCVWWAIFYFATTQHRHTNMPTFMFFQFTHLSARSLGGGGGGGGKLGIEDNIFFSILRFHTAFFFILHPTAGVSEAY
ncbi:hypothetical protein ACJX0J_013881, partial [Zea mays]